MYKKYENFETFTAADANVLMRQGLIVVENAAERNAIDNPSEGLRVYRLDTKLIEQYDGATWVDFYAPMRLFSRRAMGQSTIPASAAAAMKTMAVSFPAGRFSSAPRVFVTGWVNPSSGTVYGAIAESISTSGFTLRVATATGATFTGTAGPFDWLAVQESA